METLNLSVRVDANDKKKFEQFCDEVGMNVSTAINMFIKVVLREQKIPFEIRLPDEKPLALGSLTKEQFDAEMEKAIKDGNVVSAETSSGEIVGVMVYERKGMFAELPYLALLGVKDGYRGQAIGSRLLDVYVNICRKTGVNKCFICVSHFNPRARALYQRKGFQPVVLIPDLIRPGINEWLLMKQL